MATSAEYLGSKRGAGVYQLIVAAMPPHDTYIETHLGTGAVMRAKPPADREIGIDLDRSMVEIARASSCSRARRREFWCCDSVAFLEAFDWASAGRVVVYADPPYVWSTRTSASRYRHEYSDEDHRRLIAILRSVPAAVIVSGYPSALYDELLGDWRTRTFQAMTRGGVRTEQLWLSFPEGAPHWHTFAGVDRTDRQRIKRKAANWAAAYAALPHGERLAILAALLQAEEDGPAG
jgi:DNA adenine methylase